MHSNQLIAEQKAAAFMERCRKGFTNEYTWQRWLRQHQMEISALPTDLKAAVLLAWEQASTPEASK